MFEYWDEITICDLCGENSWGLEGWNKEMEEKGITIHLCFRCIRKLKDKMDKYGVE